MSTTPAKPVSRPWRKLLRFSVRGMIVVVLLVGGWLGWIVRSARIQREAVAAINDAGGGVSYDWESNNGKFIPQRKPWAPRWIVDLIGVDYFGHVTQVFLAPSSAAPDAVMAHVARLTRVQQLVLTSRRVSDAGLVHLNELTELTVLSVSQVTDAGLRHLEGLMKLSKLYLSGPGVTDAGLVHLKGLTNLSELTLWDTQVTDAGLAHLRGLSNLAELNLWGTQVTDAGLVHLKGLTRLSKLWLGGDQITDVGLSHLTVLTSLSELNLANTRVTETGLIDLKEALPRLRIEDSF